MIGSGGLKRSSSRYRSPPPYAYYPLCGRLSDLLAGFWRSRRVAKNRISSTIKVAQRTGTLTERAHRIAEQYLDDPAQWAAKDIKGKGITLCTRSVDPSFLGTEDDPKRTRITMVQKQIKKLEGDLAANGLSPPEIQSRRDRAAHEVKKRLQAEASQAAGTSPKKTGDKYDNETGELQTGGTVADLRMRGRWKSSVVKTEAYRSAFKYATRRYAEEVQKSPAPGAKKGDWVGACAVAAETRAKYAGVGPCGQTVFDAVKHGHTSPQKRGPACNMPQEVSDFLADVVEEMNNQKLPIFFCVKQIKQFKRPFKINCFRVIYNMFITDLAT